MQKYFKNPINQTGINTIVWLGELKQLNKE